MWTPRNNGNRGDAASASTPDGARGQAAPGWGAARAGSADATAVPSSPPASYLGGSPAAPDAHKLPRQLWPRSPGRAGGEADAGPAMPAQSVPLGAHSRHPAPPHPPRRPFPGPAAAAPPGPRVPAALRATRGSRPEDPDSAAHDRHCHAKREGASRGAHRPGRGVRRPQAAHAGMLPPWPGSSTGGRRAPLRRSAGGSEHLVTRAGRGAQGGGGGRAPAPGPSDPRPPRPRCAAAAAQSSRAPGAGRRLPTAVPPPLPSAAAGPSQGGGGGGGKLSRAGSPRPGRAPPQTPLGIEPAARSGPLAPAGSPRTDLAAPGRRLAARGSRSRPPRAGQRLRLVPPAVRSAVLGGPGRAGPRGVSCRRQLPAPPPPPRTEPGRPGARQPVGAGPLRPPRPGHARPGSRGARTPLPGAVREAGPRRQPCPRRGLRGRGGGAEAVSEGVGAGSSARPPVSPSGPAPHREAERRVSLHSSTIGGHRAADQGARPGEAGWRGGVERGGLCG